MQELKRVYRNPFWYIAFVVLAVINIVLYLIVQKDNIFCSFNEYSSIDTSWQDKISDRNTDEAISLLEDEKSMLMSLSRVLVQIEADDLEAVDAYVLENPELAGYISDLRQGKDLLFESSCPLHRRLHC